MSLRNKVVGTLLGVFVLYVLAAWFLLSFIYTPAFTQLEHQNSSDQLRRVHEFMELERIGVDLLVSDWAEWDDAMLFAKGEYDEFIEENLSGAYLSHLGMNFGAILNVDGKVIWGESYLSDNKVSTIEDVFPGELAKRNTLMSPMESGEHATGLIDTAHGPAIVSSASILWSSGRGPAGGIIVVGRLLNAEHTERIGKTVLSKVELLPAKHDLIPEKYHSVLTELMVGDASDVFLHDADYLYSFRLLKDIDGENLALLSVREDARISALGSAALNMTILTLLVAATVVTASLWSVLNGTLLRPIEKLTAVLRGNQETSTTGSDRDLVATVMRLSESSGSISKRNDEIGELIHAFDELSTSLKDATTSVWRIAHVDGLTGLANRRLFLESLDRAVQQSSSSQPVAVLFIDLDDFKNVNDEKGHDAGDKLLIEVAARIESVVGCSGRVYSPENVITGELVARIGGDEFVVLLSANGSTSEANRIAAEIVSTVAAPYQIEGQLCKIGACVGVASCPQDAQNMEDLLSLADSAMYDAKKAGKNTWRHFVEGFDSNVQKKIA
ncbi:MAG: diguanylate cyclase [Granulosicoccus sp.]